MTGRSRAELIRGLATAYRNLTELELALLDAGETADLTGIGRDASMLEIVNHLFKQGDTAWQRTVATKLIERLPNREDLQRLVARLGPAVRRPPPVHVPEQRQPVEARLFKVSDFDLSDVRADLQDAFPTTRKVLGFAIPTDEVIVATTMCEFLCDTQPPMEDRDPINLHPMSGDVVHRIEQVRNYEYELHATGITLPVLIMETPADVVRQFWDGLGDALSHVRCPLVLLFIRGVHAGLPPGVIEISGPSMRSGHVRDLVRRAADELSLTRQTAEEWAAWIMRGQGERLDVRVTMDRIRASLKHAQSKPAEFVGWLANRNGNGQS
ncbi:hypothetical protein Drose_23145 [Dactylosporangium roseum]|uniref:Effector-associated domain-containing protein n=1 Tax=Dactylosporangium roseum TaxID=47989 RepID=A0ABY5YXM0_9ACTN|nr:effector-associated domain EAD1-containing protein [Dactylosporangium roseum]UWZ34144.1 hypothetical protein Drose_23145 [Dactylosporangium roseum]